jgi:hypothetical protein
MLTSGEYRLRFSYTVVRRRFFPLYLVGLRTILTGRDLATRREISNFQ